MSLAEYQNGMFLGETIAGSKARGADARAADKIDGWINYARGLERQLEDVKLQLVKAGCSSNANNAVLGELRRRLLAAAPHDPLATPEGATQLLLAKFRQAVESRGYRVANIETMDITSK